ncbi:MAG: hypothetical protein WD768_04025 [Phycisphaeraceae bacterium]
MSDSKPESEDKQFHDEVDEQANVAASSDSDTATDTAAPEADGSDQATDPFDEPLDGDFESPEQVLGEAMVDQLQMLLDQVTADVDAPADRDEGEINDALATALNATEEIEETAEQAEALTLELADLARQIDGLAEDPVEASPDEESKSPDELSADDIRQMTRGAAASSSVATPSATAAKPADEPPAPSTEAIGQIDEYLSGQADTAVANEFETVHDVMAAEQAQDAAVADAAMRDDPGDPDAIDGEGAAPIAEAAQENEAPQEATAEGHSAPNASHSHVRRAAAAEDSVSTDASDEDPSLKSRLARIARKAGKVAVVTLFTACTLVNKPLRNSSDTTKKIVGYAALITLANASMLLVGKYVLGIFG